MGSCLQAVEGAAQSSPLALVALIVLTAAVVGVNLTLTAKLLGRMSADWSRRSVRRASARNGSTPSSPSPVSSGCSGDLSGDASGSGTAESGKR